MQHVETGVVVFIGLHVLLFWRFLSWSCCGELVSKFVGSRRLDYAGYLNYTVCLYVLLGVMLVYATSLYFELDDVASAAITYISSWGHSGQLHGSEHVKNGWLKPFCTGAVVAVCAAFSASFVQAMQHLEKMQRGRAGVQHDRAIQVIALPAVYGVMALSALTEVNQLVRSGSVEDDKLRKLALSKSEACYRVGDLYEAWVLYQFGRLTMSLIVSSIRKQQNSLEHEERGRAHGLMMAHEAVESLMWLGTWMFVVVCVLQSGWSLWVLAFAQPGTSSFENTSMAFTAAGMVASASAIWNVHVVETVYYDYLKGYSPYVKFISVKILVSFAFFQRGAFWCFQGVHRTLPNMYQALLTKVPLVGEVLSLSEVEFELFFAALILYEILFIALLHLWAWGAEEDWYLEFYSLPQVGDPLDEFYERWPLVSQGSAMKAKDALQVC
eukprot:TRINITY_DN101769_c0_g1_i1.p1 TRINITY_DN101769_c0_g1~~TRINITY_DN101769_c0_g1_i1.p1  ORF type:complete len:440 (-),score=81.58 TRINITY_DN101769_c0_g1_i1:79-1398(-)